MMEFSQTKKIKSRKEHVCDMCGGRILCGEQYVRYSGKYEGIFFDEKYHVMCNEAVNLYGEESGEYEYDPDNVREFVIEEYCREHCPCWDEESDRYDSCEENEFTCPKVKAWISEKRCKDGK